MKRPKLWQFPRAIDKRADFMYATIAIIERASSCVACGSPVILSWRRPSANPLSVGSAVFECLACGAVRDEEDHADA